VASPQLRFVNLFLTDICCVTNCLVVCQLSKWRHEELHIWKNLGLFPKCWKCRGGQSRVGGSDVCNEMKMGKETGVRVGYPVCNRSVFAGHCFSRGGSFKGNLRIFGFPMNSHSSASFNHLCKMASWTVSCQWRNTVYVIITFDGWKPCDAFPWKDNRQCGRGFVFSWFNYCNSRLAGLPKLNTVCKIPPRLIRSVGPRGHVTSTLRDLHWLPSEQRIIFKMCSLMHLFNTETGLNIYENLSRWHSTFI